LSEIQLVSRIVAGLWVRTVHREFERLRALGFELTQDSAEMGPVSTAVFDDTCGNVIQITQTR
jgi:hypothetical protein